MAYQAQAKVLYYRSSQPQTLPKLEKLPGSVAIVSAGTADLTVAEECRVVAEHMGCYCYRVVDVAAEGLHRVLQALPALRAADVVVVVAGMDASLPSVIAGMVEAPVVSNMQHVSKYIVI